MLLRYRMLEAGEMYTQLNTGRVIQRCGLECGQATQGRQVELCVGCCARKLFPYTACLFEVYLCLTKQVIQRAAIDCKVSTVSAAP